MSSKLKALVAKIAQALKTMRVFCMKPSHANYMLVLNEPSAVRLGAMFDCWQQSVLFKYGEEWGLPVDVDKFMLMDSTLCTKAIESPSLSTSMCVMGMYYGTGELKYIDLFYQCMGNHHLSTSTRRELMGVFKDTKSEYIDYLSSHEVTSIPISNVDFSYFDGIKDKYQEIKRCSVEL